MEKLYLCYNPNSKHSYNFVKTKFIQSYCVYFVCLTLALAFRLRSRNFLLHKNIFILSKTIIRLKKKFLSSNQRTYIQLLCISTPSDHTLFIFDRQIFTRVSDFYRFYQLLACFICFFFKKVPSFLISSLSKTHCFQ